MKYGFKIGKIVIQGTTTKQVSTAITATSTEVISLKEDVILEGVELELDISVDEMKESFSQFKEVCSGIKELYLFVKEELVTGEVMKAAVALNQLVPQSAPETEEEK